jgi:hypothetical protein
MTMVEIKSICIWAGKAVSTFGKALSSLSLGVLGCLFFVFLMLGQNKIRGDDFTSLA